MPHKYVLVARKSLLRPEEEPMFYAQAVSGKTVDVSTICKRIGQRSSYSHGELEGAIGEFLIEIQNTIEEGNIAQLGRLGNFRLTLRTETPTLTAKGFSNANIKGSRVRFYPSAELRAMCKAMTYTQQASISTSTSTGGGNKGTGEE